MQTRNRFRPLCLLLLLAAASACCPCRKYQKLYGAPLVGTRWLLIQLDGEEVANSDGRFSLRFEDAKRLSGRGGCNRYSASCDAEAGGHLRVGPIASTRMTCPEAQRERAFFAMLRSAVRYELDAKMLILSDSTASVRYSRPQKRIRTLKIKRLTDPSGNSPTGDHAAEKPPAHIFVFCR